MNTAETIAYYQGLTKRQLFKAYRDAVTHLNECNEQYNTGHDYLHGERIVPYQRAAQTEVYLIEKVLIEKEYSMPMQWATKIPRFTIDQRREFIRNRQLQQEKTSLENTIARFKVGSIMENGYSTYVITGNWLDDSGEMLITYISVYNYDDRPGQQFTGEVFYNKPITQLLSENHKIV
jgi:hypothetical protein